MRLRTAAKSALALLVGALTGIGLSVAIAAIPRFLESFHQIHRPLFSWWEIAMLAVFISAGYAAMIVPICLVAWVLAQRLGYSGPRLSVVLGFLVTAAVYVVSDTPWAHANLGVLSSEMLFVVPYAIAGGVAGWATWICGGARSATSLPSASG